MHRKKGASLELKDILAKLKGNTVRYKVTYASKDVAKAKAILDRLLSTSTRNEVSYIRDVPTVVEDTEEPDTAIEPEEEEA